MEIELKKLNTLIRRILSSVDPLTFKVEEYYQFLKEKPDCSEDEKLLFDAMDHFRSTLIDSPFKALNEKLSNYIDWDGLPIKLWEWCIKCEYLNKHIGQDIINGWFISTVWLGINHNFYTTGSPLIFETMIFKNDENAPDNEFFADYIERYSTSEEALEGHMHACEQVKMNTKEIINESTNQQAARCVGSSNDTDMDTSLE